MSISIVATLAMIFSAIGVVIGLAMFFLVLWQTPRHRDNQLMAFYMITMIIRITSGRAVHLRFCSPYFQDRRKHDDKSAGFNY